MNRNMIHFWKKIDAFWLETVDGFVVHLQSVFRTNYATTVSLFSLAAATVSALGGIAIFRGQFASWRLPASLVWIALLASMIAMFRNSYWKDSRRWDDACVDHWTKFSYSLRRRTAALRATLLLLPVVTSAPMVILYLAQGQPLAATVTLMEHATPFIPMLLIVYAMCSPPAPAGL